MLYGRIKDVKLFRMRSNFQKEKKVPFICICHPLEFQPFQLHLKLLESIPS